MLERSTPIHRVLEPSYLKSTPSIKHLYSRNALAWWVLTTCAHFFTCVQVLCDLYCMRHFQSRASISYGAIPRTEYTCACYSWKKSLLSRSARHCQKLATVQTYSNDHARNNPRRRQITWKRLSQSHVLTLHKNFVKSGRHHTTIITGHNWIYPETCARKWPHAQKNAVTGNMLASVVAPSLDLFLKKRSTV